MDTQTVLLILTLFLVVSLFVCIMRVLNFILDELKTLIVEDRKMSDDLDDVDSNLSTLQTAVASEETVVDGAVTLIHGIPDLITAAVQAAEGAGPKLTAAQKAIFSDLGTRIVNKAGQLAAAVASAPSGNVTTGDPGGSDPITDPAPIGDVTQAQATSNAKKADASK